MKVQLVFILAALVILSLFLIPYSDVSAQGGCFDASGNPIPCPTPVKRTPRPTKTLPPTFTATPTASATSTSTLTSTPTFTPTATVTITNTPTSSPTVTATFTPTPPSVATAVLPGAGIGLFILLLIVGILLPIGQKLRVAKRGY